jgi:hypothetical protein
MGRRSESAPPFHNPMKKLTSVLISLLFALASPAQYDPTVDQLRYYEANYAFSLSGTAATFTVKLPANSLYSVVGSVAMVCSTVDTNITQEMGGTATGGTAVTKTALNTPSTSVATILRGATTASGVTVGVPIAIRANECSPPIDLTKVKLRMRNASDQVYNIKSESETGTVRVSVIFAESNR